MSQGANGVLRTPSDRKHSSPSKPFSEKRSRPSSAPRQARTPSHNRYSSPSTVKSKSSPSQLYEDLLVLKMEIAYLKDQNSRLQSKLLQAEIISQRDEPPANPLFGSSLQRSHLVSSLKHTIRQLKAELKRKEDETGRLKRDMKVSRTAELEVELQAYIDECMRLRHHIEEVLVKRLGNGEEADSLEGVVRNLAGQRAGLEAKVSSLQGELKRAKEEIGEFQGKLGFQPDLQTFKAQVRTLSSQNEANTSRIKQLEAELASSKAEITQLTSQLAAKTASFPSIYTASIGRPAPGPELSDSHYEISFREGDKGDSDACEQALITEIEQSGQRPLQQFAERCRKAVLEASERERRGVMRALEGSPVAEEVYEALEEAGVVTSPDEVATFLDQLPALLLPALQSPNKADTPLQRTLKVLSYRLQLHRVPKTKLPQLLFGEQYAADTEVTGMDLAKTLSSPPCSVAAEDCEAVVAFLLNNAGRKAGKMKDIVTRLQTGLENWEVYSTEDENEFDHHISTLITLHMHDFLTLCMEKDPNQTGAITMQALKSICSSLNLPFSQSEFHYMELLFFSLNFELDEVPYRKFIQAYVTEEELADTNSEAEMKAEEDRQRFVQHYLYLIADQLAAFKLSIAQVFPTQDGVLYPDKLVAGLKRLSVPALKKEELVVFVETLQSEEIEEYGIDMSLFADLLKECGQESSRDWGSEHSY